MSHQFQGSRSPVQGGSMPFYNPQKDAINPNNPVLYPNNNPPVPGFTPSSNSKSYISRSNIMELPKPANNSSAYLKNSNESPVPPGKFHNNITSPSNFGQSGHANFPPGFPNKIPNSQMVKSSFHDNKGSESTVGSMGQPPQISEKTPPFISNTPPRRAPRMSEGGGGYEPSAPPTFPKDFKYKPQAIDKLTDSPLIKRPKDQIENTFLKNKPVDKEEKMSKFEVGGTKSEIFRKSSPGKKKAVSVSDFTYIKELGSGKYGQVSLVQQKKTGFMCALKKVEKKLLIEQQIIEQFVRELKIQTYLSHPNIIKMYGFFDDATHIYIILQVGTGGQLYHQLRKSEPMNEAKVAGILKQVCDSVNEIHSLKIIHRDIKPENIVLHENVIKLCDFGWSVYQDNRLRTTFCGTPIYVCPEILKGKEYDEKIDIWSLGIMMYEMLVGENPFKITKEEELIKIVKDEISIPSYIFVSREGRDLLDKCLRKNPSDRVSIKELINHQFFTNNAEKEKDKKMAF